jgi:hypothetical protein
MFSTRSGNGPLCGSRRIRRLLAPQRRLIVCSRQAPIWSGRPIAMRWPTASTARTYIYGTSIRRRSIAFRVDPQAGSAAAVAGELVDFALGTDCACPRVICGIFGIRTSYGLVPADGVVKLAPGFDTIGWFARTAAMMRQIGEVLQLRDPLSRAAVRATKGQRAPRDLETATS